MPPIASVAASAAAVPPAGRAGPAAAVRSPRFPTFEGLRALSALAVVAYHAGTLTGLTTGQAAAGRRWGPWLQHLNVGVAVFFVLSGFLLFRPFVAAHLSDAPPPTARTYLVRRLVRIFPAYWVALAVSTWLLHLDLGDWWGHVRFYGLLQIYSGDTVLGGLVQAWSLCTELSFYLFLPVWAAGLARVGGTPERRARAHLLGCAALYALGIGFRARLRAGGHAIGYAWLPANTDLFALGMVLAVVSADAARTGRSPNGLARTLGEVPAAAWAAAVCCYLAVVSLRYPYGLVAPTVFQELARQVLFGLVAVLIVAPGVFGRQDRGGVRSALRWRPLAAVGIVSYGVYLWHLTLMERLVPHLRPRAAPGLPAPPPSWPGLAGSAALAAVAVAAASWFALERPLLERVGRARRRRIAPGETRP